MSPYPPNTTPGYSPTDHRDLGLDLTVNNSGEPGEPPLEVQGMGFSWGALLLVWIWCFAHRIWVLGAAFLVIDVAVAALQINYLTTQATDTTGLPGMWFGVAVGVYLLLRCALATQGQKLAWRYRHFPYGFEQFREVQNKWAVAGAICFALNLFSSAIVRSVANSMTFFTRLSPCHQTDGHFTIDLPTAPTESTRTVTVSLPTGTHNISLAAYTSEANKSLIYIVYYFRIPDDVIVVDTNKSLEAGVNAAMDTFGATIIERHYVIVNHASALEFTSEATDKDLDIHGREMLLGKDHYTMMVACRHGANPNTDRFFNSFKPDPPAALQDTAPTTQPVDATPAPSMVPQPAPVSDTSAPQPAKGKTAPHGKPKAKSAADSHEDMSEPVDVPEDNSAQPNNAYPSAPGNPGDGGTNGPNAQPGAPSNGSSQNAPAPDAGGSSQNAPAPDAGGAPQGGTDQTPPNGSGYGGGQGQ